MTANDLAQTTTTAPGDGTAPTDVTGNAHRSGGNGHADRVTS